MVELPVDSRLAKLVLLGCCFGAVDETLTVAAALACPSSLFLTPFDAAEGREIAAARLQLAGDTQSDHVASLRAYRRYYALPLGVGGASMKLCARVGKRSEVPGWEIWAVSRLSLNLSSGGSLHSMTGGSVPSIGKRLVDRVALCKPPAMPLRLLRLPPSRPSWSKSGIIRLAARYYCATRLQFWAARASPMEEFGSICSLIYKTIR